MTATILVIGIVVCYLAGAIATFLYCARQGALHGPSATFGLFSIYNKYSKEPEFAPFVIFWPMYWIINIIVGILYVFLGLPFMFLFDQFDRARITDRTIEWFKNRNEPPKSPPILASIKDEKQDIYREPAVECNHCGAEKHQWKRTPDIVPLLASPVIHETNGGETFIG